MARGYRNSPYPEDFILREILSLGGSVVVSSDCHDATKLDFAFEETIHGLYNLNSEGIDIELRIVINAINFRRLANLSNYIFKNLPFVSWVAFMGMEHTGYAVSNEKIIWIEPIEYRSELANAVKTLASWNIDVSVYNIPHCLLDNSIWNYAQKSISDWKTRYLSTCEKCTMKDKCCGLFSTSKNIYKNIKNIILYGDIKIENEFNQAIFNKIL
jgi:His-Xaa-Ser system radical SAM maturase HxsC